MPHNPDSNIKILALNDSHVSALVDSFKQAKWDKPATLFEQYLKEGSQGQRDNWVALCDGDIAGYITLSWQSKYQPFLSNNIPEIMDLNVLPQYRNNGVGSKLLTEAESTAFIKSNTVGIGVGLYAGEDGGYGAAQKLYIKAGYIPNGHGITYNYKHVTPGTSYPVDDELTLWLIKNKD